MRLSNEMIIRAEYMPDSDVPGAIDELRLAQGVIEKALDILKARVISAGMIAGKDCIAKAIEGKRTAFNQAQFKANEPERFALYVESVPLVTVKIERKV